MEDATMAERKTNPDWRMLEPPPAATSSTPAAGSAAGRPGAGKIVFNCPNGHRLVVPARIAGQRGKCSKCGIAVSIPAATEPQAAPPRAGDAAGAPVAAEIPASQADGRDAGQTDVAAESRGDIFTGIAGAAAGRAGDSHNSSSEFVGLSSASQPSFVGVPDPGPAAAPEPAVDTSLRINPTAALVARLFQEMEHGGIVEVHLTGGSVILPEFYEARWSGGSHGLFASRAADGTVTLTAVAWDAIQKIVVRQVNGLPDGMFEEAS